MTKFDDVGEIRVAASGDAKAIQSLVMSLSHFYLEDIEAPLPKWFLKTLSLDAVIDRLTSSEYQTLVYVEDGIVCGYVSIKSESHLYHLFVCEEHQGKGIARQLWNAITSGSDVNTYTVRSSLYAVPVYERLGFQRTGEVASKEGICYLAMSAVLKR
ncbi:GNAT family N-acetyltransferase [Marinomonas sp. C2222]|uniref:GNAT family N-acetyltransferase n=1 Tax=Marinomonas sargassi TaxID=2984494 RepID=A0ABT2YRA3_9GAMM|nr:GNAT family N-acetyltransferase [Marinomonas sargassi]MCV2402428.1 GNAT family N-acetyltransferase [Marinomonas sargassi]